VFDFQSVFGSHLSCFFLLQALAIIASTLFTIDVHYGYGQDTSELAFDYAVLAVKFYTITQACVIGSSTAGRVAFILYLQAILGGEMKHRIILLTLAILEVAFNAVSIILIFTYCKNVELISNKALHVECLNRQKQYAYFQSGTPISCLLLRTKGYVPAIVVIPYNPRLHVIPIDCSPLIAFNTAVDLYLVMVPTWIFWGLNLRLGVKVSLIVLMSLGLM
jgi:hypothetical protein